MAEAEGIGMGEAAHVKAGDSAKCSRQALPRVLAFAVLCLFGSTRDSGWAASTFFEREQSFGKDQQQFESSFKSFFRVESTNDAAKLIGLAIGLSEQWSGNNEYYRVAVLNDAYWRLLESPVPKGILASNQIFLASLLIPKLTNVPPDFAMTVMNNLWSTLSTQGREENVEEWSLRRKENIEAWFSTADRAKAEFKPEFLGLYSLINVSPPPGSKLSPGSSPEGEPDPVLREKYCESIEQNRLAHQKIQTAHSINRDLPKFETRAETLAAMLYSKPPYALVELQEILDRRVSDERATNIMNAVFRAMPKAVAATLPRPIPHVGDANRVNPAAVGASNPGLPAVARPSKIRDGFTNRPNQGAVASGNSGSSTPEPESTGSGTSPSGSRPVWPWAVLGLVVLGGGWGWLKSRG